MTFFKKILPVLIGVGAYIFVFGAHAQENRCGPRADVLKAYFEQFSEVPVWHGIAENGSLLERLESPDGTWTMITTSIQETRNGKKIQISCVVLTGEYSENIKPKPTSPEERDS